jgi:nicotinamidase-related amidase
MQIKKCALVVIDVQNGFLTDETQHILPAVTELVDRWSKRNGVAVYTRYFNYSGSAFERLMDWKKLYTAPDTDLANDLLPYAQNSIILDKRTYSALTPDFEELIRRHGWTNAMLCGIDTELCVLKTALDLFEHDLTPWIITNASASTGGRTYHEAGLQVISRAVGQHHLLTTEDLYKSLT